MCATKTIAASLPVPALKSQIEMMTGKVVAHAPQSAVARLIAGELKGGEVKHNYIMSVIASAIEQAYKGNTRDIPEAVKLCSGKAVKARAYCAGFHAIADMVAPIQYSGKLADAHNASVRADIADKSARAAAEFEKAYLMTFVDAKAAALDKKAEKAATEAKSVPAAEVAPLAVAPVATVDAVVVNIDDSVNVVSNAIRMGVLDPVELALIRGALAAFDQYGASQPEALDIEPVLLVA